MWLRLSALACVLATSHCSARIGQPTTRLGNGSAARPVTNEPDLDSDGVPDRADRCPQVVEDFDGFKDDDGCPEIDNDADGFPDPLDGCPLAAETPNQFQDTDGCPDEAPPAPPAPPPLRIDLHVRFATRKAEVTRRAARMVQRRVCPLLLGRMEHDNLRVDVVGFADDRGSETFNRQLSTDRATAVANLLLACGLPPTRIESHGLGDSRLICPDNTYACRRQNRRVEFLLYPMRPPAPPSP